MNSRLMRIGKKISLFSNLRFAVAAWRARTLWCVAMDHGHGSATKANCWCSCCVALWQARAACCILLVQPVQRAAAGARTLRLLAHQAWPLRNSPCVPVRRIRSRRACAYASEERALGRNDRNGATSTRVDRCMTGALPAVVSCRVVWIHRYSCKYYE